MRKLFVSSCTLLAFATMANAELFSAELTIQHEVAASWKSEETGSADAQLRISEDGKSLSVFINVRGIGLSELASAGHHGSLGPIHIHNLPQGGDQFFVLQLPGQFDATGDGFTLTLEDWPIEAPGGGAKVSPKFVVEEIRSGNAYFGLHTSNVLCENADGQSIECAAPATALSGQIISD